MHFVATVFLFAFNNLLIRLANDKDELIDKLLIKMGYSDDKKKKAKNEDNTIKMKDLILGVDILYQEKKIYTILYILNVIAFILEIILCFIVGISNNSNWESLLEKMYVFSSYEGVTLLAIIYIY